mmetsp:Transcript_20680/g.61676  ORF Transcript_20680/g.61676 Transcript_20680/m.61676 type:complete len:222 (-) Transcript_20680:96-761(-)
MELQGAPPAAAVEEEERHGVAAGGKAASAMAFGGLAAGLPPAAHKPTGRPAPKSRSAKPRAEAAEAASTSTRLWARDDEHHCERAARAMGRRNMKASASGAVSSTAAEPLPARNSYEAELPRRASGRAAPRTGLIRGRASTAHVGKNFSAQARRRGAVPHHVRVLWRERVRLRIPRPQLPAEHLRLGPVRDCDMSNRHNYYVSSSVTTPRTRGRQHGSPDR